MILVDNHYITKCAHLELTSHLHLDVHVSSIRIFQKACGKCWRLEL